MRKSELHHLTKDEFFEYLENRYIEHTNDCELLLRAVEIIKEQEQRIYNLQLALGMIPKGELHE